MLRIGCCGKPNYAVLFCLQIGGVRAPSPVGELGNVEMTQAVSLAETSWQVVGPDMLLTGDPPTALPLRAST